MYASVNRGGGEIVGLRTNRPVIRLQPPLHPTMPGAGTPARLAKAVRAISTFSRGSGRWHAVKGRRLHPLSLAVGVPVRSGLGGAQRTRLIRSMRRPGSGCLALYWHLTSPADEQDGQ